MRGLPSSSAPAPGRPHPSSPGQPFILQLPPVQLFRILSGWTELAAPGGSDPGHVSSLSELLQWVGVARQGRATGGSRRCWLLGQGVPRAGAVPPPRTSELGHQLGPPPAPSRACEHLGHSAGALGLAPTPDRMLQPLVAEPPTGSPLPLSPGWPWGWPSVSSGCEVAITSSFRETEFEGKSKCLAQLQPRGPSQRPPAHSIKKSTFSINSGDSPSPPGEDEGMWRGPPRLPCSVHTAAQRPWLDSFTTFSSAGHMALQSLSVPSISWSPGRRGCAWAGAGLPPPEG